MSDLDLSRRAMAAGLRWAPGMRTTTGMIVGAVISHGRAALEAGK